ncbi:MAG: acyl-CoA dehydrogenase family protein [Thermoanaerobaculum sp.]|nr:acyl-CoA dehydrogenase family protein [Thermoanaerobaculum sp.]MDW7967761.1 acyl-CoA dehydrogenase family protein [Thermoanaerobaculum sp.]
MDFRFTDQQRMIRQMVREFARERVAPGARQRDETGQFPWDLFRQMAELGLLGMVTPEAYGGSQLDLLSYLIAIEELAWADASVAVGVSVHNSVCQWPIVHFGSDELKQRVLPPLARGEVLGGIMLTEPDAGSDLASLSTTYKRVGNEFVLSGSKMWITNAGIAKYFVVLATKDKSLGHRGITAFVLDAEQEGVQVDPPEKKMGLRSSVTAGVTLEEARVPAGNLLGEEGQGFKVALATLDHSRLGIAAQALGIAQAALDASLQYAKERVQFGKPIIQHQAIGFRLADMDTELEAARWLTYRAAWLAEQGGQVSRTSAQAKLFATETANRICNFAVQVFGGYGYSREYVVERLYRDVRVTTVYEGTSEVQRMVIARALERLSTTAPEA